MRNALSDEQKYKGRGVKTTFYKIFPPFGLNLNIFEIEYILTGADMTPRTELYHGI